MHKLNYRDGIKLSPFLFIIFAYRFRKPSIIYLKNEGLKRRNLISKYVQKFLIIKNIKLFYFEIFLEKSQLFIIKRMLKEYPLKKKTKILFDNCFLEQFYFLQNKKK